MPTWRIVVRGRVQGVGFRAFVESVAQCWGVDGEVWNRSDGAVEAIAQHEREEVLREFADVLMNGPGRVDDVACEEFPDAPKFTDFRIRFFRG